MDLSRLTDKAKQVIEDRGGMDALKADAAELKDIATGGGSLTDKAKAALEAIKDEGAVGEDVPRAGDARPDGPASPPPPGR